jgi:hypothetical protein
MVTHGGQGLCARPLCFPYGNKACAGRDIDRENVHRRATTWSRIGHWFCSENLRATSRDATATLQIRQACTRAYACGDRPGAGSSGDQPGAWRPKPAHKRPPRGPRSLVARHPLAARSNRPISARDRALARVSRLPRTGKTQARIRTESCRRIPLFCALPSQHPGGRVPGAPRVSLIVSNWKTIEHFAGNYLGKNTMNKTFP